MYAGASSDFSNQPSCSGERSSCEYPDDLLNVWSVLVKSWPLEGRKDVQKLEQLVRQGIPKPFRTLAWQLLSNAEQDNGKSLYAEYMRASSPHEKAIRRDVTRTFPGHQFFDESSRGQQSLFNVMKAYSLYDKEVGYCQGSAFVVGMLLLLMPEEEAFAVLLKLMQEYRLRELYKPSMSELGVCLFKLECLVQELMPDISSHFHNVGVDTTMYASSWFLTMFSSTLPIELSFRIMDIFLCEGFDILFQVALAILQLCRVDLFSLDMEGVLRYLQRDLAKVFLSDHDRLFTVAFDVQLNKKRMQKFEKEYAAKRAKDQQEAAELKGIKAENKLLRHKIEYLEQESGSLADRLIDRQVSLAQGAEDLVNLNHELAQLRKLHSGVKDELEKAYETIRSLLSKKGEMTDFAAQADDQALIEHIQTLQEELIRSQTNETNLHLNIKDLNRRVNELETANKRLRELPPENSVATLQEELIAAKMREAEANLSLKEVGQKFVELSNEWAAQASASLPLVGESYDSAPTHPRRPAVKDLNTANNRIKELEELVIGVRIRETSVLVEMKEMRQRVMELETQNHMFTNQIRRQDEELKSLICEHDKCATKEKEYQLQLLDERCRANDLESQIKEITMVCKLSETELLQANGELKNKICELESGLMECWTRQELSRSDIVADFSDDEIGLEATQRILSSEEAKCSLLNGDDLLKCEEVDRIDTSS